MQHAWRREAQTALVRQSFADGAYEIVRQRIVTGTIAPGERLFEPVLAKELGVSRTPVREALRRLEQEGLVQRNPRDLGRYVQGLSRHEVTEIIGIRAVLEGYAARLAAGRISDAELKAMRVLDAEAREVIEQGDVERLVELNTSFHGAIVAASRAPRCAAIIEGLKDRILRYRFAFLRSDELRRKSLREHGEILRALEGRDGERAEGVVRRHIAAIADALVSDAPAEEGPVANTATHLEEGGSWPREGS